MAVVGWDSIFPDRRDVMVLSPLPVAPHTILFSKVAASASLLGLAILAFNFATGIAWPLYLGTQQSTPWGFFRALAAYWFTMTAASTFLYCSVLTAQGLMALLLPRRLFLRLSAFLQLTAFALFLSVYVLQPSITKPAEFIARGNHSILAWSPCFWFFALFNQLNGTLHPDLAWLVWKAWIGLAVVLSGATVSLLLCYLRTMKMTAEQPDLVPRAHKSRWSPRSGNPLQTAIVFFSLRSLTRSRQHRLIFAFFLALVFSLTLSVLRSELLIPSLLPLSPDFLSVTFIMMVFATVGLRCVFSLPISLRANWILRTTQLCPPGKYVAATRRVLLLLAVVPIWCISALLSLSFRPVHHVVAHLAILALVGWLFVELSLIGSYKVPFTCSYLPGKVHIQLVLLYCAILLFAISMLTAEYELPLLSTLPGFFAMVSVISAAAAGIWTFNRWRANSAVLYYEELPPAEITTLGLIHPPVPADSKAAASH